MGLIHVLDTEVSNKIAAGEVVERPLSIVKELVENSIDAGATTITVEIKDGGIAYIRVTDNGCGMSEDDARMCFLRHATSKIQEDSDLDAIYTLGFRGEALSSIGAVAKVRIYTKRRQDENGICVTCEGGEIISSVDTGAPDGTVAEVSDLFYNTPARLKFLKKPTTEAGYIYDIISRYVFAHPEISFKLIRNGKEVLFSSGDNKLINSVYAVYGKDYARNMLEVDYEYNGIRVTGVIGKGTLTRANRNYESFFVNRRYIKSAIMIRALEEAYKNQIMISKFPTAILNIDIDAHSVDINVHPTKLECKFSNEQDIYQAVYHAVKSALYELPNVPEIKHKESSVKTPEEQNKGIQLTIERNFSDELRESLKPSNNFKFKSEHRNQISEPPIPRSDALRKEEEIKRDITEVTPAITSEQIETEENKFARYMKRANEAEAEPMQKAVEAPTVENETIESDKNVKADAVSDEKDESLPVDTFAMLDFAKLQMNDQGNGRVMDSTAENQKGKKQTITWQEYRDIANERYRRKLSKEKEIENVFAPGDFRIIGQLFDTYILVEKDDKLLMVDQHAAHERLNYEELKRQLADQGITSQMIMIPVVIKLSGEELAVYKENQNDFFELGFECNADENNNISITSVPGDISWSEVEPLFMELLTQMRDMKQQLISETKQRLLYTISCKAAIKANMEIGEQEMTALVGKVFALKNINTCPHGRPIVISMSKKEIEKDFKRIV